MSDNGAAALASILHDTYGCRITCRGGRLANDRHPSHAEAYLDTAAAILGERGVFLPDGLDAAFDFLARTNAEQAAEIATLRAALDGLVEVAEAYTTALDADLYRPGTPEDWWNREAALAALRSALATAKETP